MSHETPIYRTTPARTAKMMAIMCGVCIAGGALFFAFWDYWISMTPGNQAIEHGPSTGTGAATGKTIPITLTFVESSDFKQLAFNALPGEEGNNPTIEASVGDKIDFEVTNNGVSFHAFGVTKAESGFEGVVSGSAIGSMNSPLKAGQSGSASFVPSEEGTFYYICTIPGHRDLGMVGEIKVGPKGEAPKAAAPTGVKQSFDLNFVESSDFKQLAFNALPGEEGNNPEIKVKSGDTVTIKSANNGISFHSFGVVSNPDDVNSIVFSSAIGSMNNPIKPKEAKEVTFTAGAPGSYYYICTVPGHGSLGMKGNFIVE
jgi:nitrite reductase (NO-forming)